VIVGERDADETTGCAGEEPFPKRSGIPDPRAFLMAVLPMLEALMPDAGRAAEAGDEVRACRM
jgi:hypothetical protein